MAISIGTVEGTIRLRDEFTSRLNASASQLEKHGQRMQVVGRQMSSVGSLLTAGITLPMIAAGGAAIKMAMDLNEGMANVATLIPGNTARVVDLRTEIQGLAVDVGKTTSDLTAGLYQTISAFGDTAETVEVLEINARAATAGLSTTLEAIDLTSAVTKGYGDTSAAAVQKAADLALITVRLGQTTFPDLASSMGRVIPLAEAVGQSQEEMFAVFATATGVVGRASEVATQYRGVINALLKPTADLEKLIVQQGFASGEAMLRQLGLVDTLQLIGDTAKATGRPITDYIAQIEAVPLALALAGPQADVFRQKLEAMAGAAGATDAAFREQTEGVNAAGFAWKQTQAEVQVALQQLGQELLPVLTTLLGALQPVVGALEGTASALAAMPKPAQLAALGLAGLVAAAGPALFISGQMITAWGTLATTFPRLAAGIAMVGRQLLTVNPILTVTLGLLLALNEAVKGWGERSSAAMADMVADTNRVGKAVDELRKGLQAGEISAGSLERAREAARALGDEIGRVGREINKKNRELKDLTADRWVMQKEEVKKLEKELAQLGTDRSNLERFIRLASDLPVVLQESEDAAEGAGGPPGGVTQFSDALGDAVKSMADTIAETGALLDAQIKSQAAYDTLNTLIQAGVPLEDALTGEYDRQANILILLTKASADLSANREKAAELAKDLAENEKELADAITLELAAWEDLAAAREAGDTPAAVVFDVDQIAVARAAVEKLRAEEERRRAVLQEINVLLAEGAITQQEAAKVAAKLGVEHSAMADALETMMKRAWENIQDAAASAISGIFEKYIDTGNDAIDALLKSFIRMLAELLVLWIANAAKRAAAERAVAASSSAAAAAGGGGGGGWLSSLGSLFGGGGGGGSSSGWAAGGALGALAITGVVAAFVVWQHSESAKRLAKRWFGIAEVREGWNAMFGPAEVLQVTEAIRDQVSEIFAAIGGSLASLPSISVDVQASGEQFRSFVDGVLVGYFKTFEEAFAAAALQAVEQSDLSRMIPEIAAALQAGTIYSLDQLQDVAEVFATIRQALDPTGASVDAFNAQIEEMGRILDAAGIARTVLADFEAAGWQALRDQITGVTKSAQQLFNEQMESFNRRIEEQRAIETAALAAAQAEQAAAAAEVARLTALIAGLQAMAVLSDKQAQFLAGLIQNLAIADALLASSAAAAAAAQAALDALPEPIKPSEFRGGGGGSSRKADMESLVDLLDQMRFDRLLAGMTELEAGLARLAREYDQNVEKAHGNAELVAQLTEEYRLQAEQLVRNIQIAAGETFQDFLGIGEDPFSQLRESWENAKKAVEDAGFGADRTAVMLQRLNRAYKDQLAILSRQQFVSLGDSLMGILERYYGDVEGFERFRMNLERLRFELEIANLRIQFEVLKAQGDVSRRLLRQMGRVFDFIDANPIDWGEFVTPSVPVNAFREAASTVSDAFEEMARRLASAKEGITDFLLSLQTGAFGGRSNLEAFTAAYEQAQTAIVQARGGNIQAFEQFPELARRALELARERYGSTAEFQRILAEFESAGIDLLGVSRVTKDNVVFDQRFFDAQRQQIEVDRSGHQAVANAVLMGFQTQADQEDRRSADLIEEIRGLRRSQDELSRRIEAIQGRLRTEKRRSA